MNVLSTIVTGVINVVLFLFAILVNPLGLFILFRIAEYYFEERKRKW